MAEKDLIQKLEELNTTLGALIAVIPSSTSEAMEKVHDNVIKLQRVLTTFESEGVGKLARVNRELTAQLDGIKKIISPE